MEPIISQPDKSKTSYSRNDLHQKVTDTIIEQLEAGTIPWHQPWIGNENRILSLPKNITTNKNYRGINILLLWCSTLDHDYTTQEWATFKQWQEKKEAIRKGEKGTLIVYYDVLEKEINDEIKEIPFLKSSYVFNRCQLTGYQPPEQSKTKDGVDTFEHILHVDTFVKNTGAIVEHKGSKACYIPSLDKIWMPEPQAFTETATCTPAEGYYSTLLHELTHWTGGKDRRNRINSKKFGDENYAVEELVAELGAAFLCAEFEINLLPKGDHANYIAHWLKVLKENKHCLFTASGEASKAIEFLYELQPRIF